MRASLHFNLPEEREEHLHALSGSRYKAKIDDLYDEVFRGHIKYDHPIAGQSLSQRDLNVIDALWLKVSDHFNMDDI